MVPPSVWTRVLGISECTMPSPAVIHWTSPGADDTLVASGVSVFDLSFEHVGDGLETPMRVRRHTGGLPRLMMSWCHLIEEKERIEPVGYWYGERSINFQPAAFDGGLRGHDFGEAALNLLVGRSHGGLNPE